MHVLPASENPPNRLCLTLSPPLTHVEHEFVDFADSWEVDPLDVNLSKYRLAAAAPPHLSHLPLIASSHALQTTAVR